MTAALELLPAPLSTSVDGRPVSPPGVIGAAVIRAGRRGARLTRRRLARDVAVTPATVRGWEDGTLPLYAIAYRDLCRMASALGTISAGVDIADLAVAGQCDLLITGMLHGSEDYAEVPPIEEPGPRGDLAREFLRWALAGTVPGRFRSPAAPGQPLLAPADVATLTSLAWDLRAGTAGPELATFGATVLTLAEH